MNIKYDSYGEEFSVGIDASRNRSGGARAHIRGVLSNFDPSLGVKVVHIWAYRSLLDDLPDQPWLVKHHHPFLERNLFYQVVWQSFFLRRAARRLGCDVLFATDASTLCNFQPLVVLSQDLLSYEPGVMNSYSFGRSRLRLEAIKIVQNLAFRRARGVLFLTNYASELIQNSCGPLAVTALAPHGIDEMFRNCAARNNELSVGEVIRCVYVSNADMYKHQWHVVDAIQKLRDRNYPVELELIGGGKGEAQERLKKAMLRCDPEQRFIRQLDFISHQELPKHLAGADIYIFASSCENLPVTLLEGMAAGLPIACSNRGPMPEVLKEGGVYFDPEDSDSIANSVQRLIESKSLRSDSVTIAGKLASEYTWARCSHQTFQFIKDIYSRS